MGTSATRHENLLGDFLKDRRARLDPEAFGFGSSRRRTPGLRREEVAQRADVSATWYTWLEQGRHGAPSADVLDRLSGALQLTASEREHLFLIARPQPAIRRVSVSEVTPALQRMLDSLENNPAIIKSAAWDILAWNRAAAAVLTDYSKLEPADRNILKLLFRDPGIRSRNPHWESQARAVVATFRLQMARAGCGDTARALVDEMCDTSREFASLWRDNDVDAYGEGIKEIEHPTAGLLALEYSSYAVDGKPDLSLLIYTPATPDDLARVRALLR